MADNNSNGNNNNNSGRRDKGSSWVERGTDATANIIHTCFSNWYNPAFVLTSALPFLFFSTVLLVIWSMICGVFGWRPPVSNLDEDTSKFGYSVGSYIRETPQKKNIRLVIEDRDIRRENTPRNVTYDDLSTLQNSRSNDDNRVININATE